MPGSRHPKVGDARRVRTTRFARRGGKHSMIRPKRPKRKGFSLFRSAREEADLKVEEANRDAEGGHMSCTTGRIVSVPGSDKPFKAIMSQESGETSEHMFATMQEAEAFLRRNTPRPQPRSTTYDHGDD